MTVIVSVKINDGVVLAADSAGTMNSGHVYTHANKITHLCDGLPVAAMSTGSGGRERVGGNVAEGPASTVYRARPSVR